MAGASASKKALRPVSLKSIKPVIPQWQLEKEQLIEDLCRNTECRKYSLKVFASDKTP